MTNPNPRVVGARSAEHMTPMDSHRNSQHPRFCRRGVAPVDFFAPDVGSMRSIGDSGEHTRIRRHYGGTYQHMAITRQRASPSRVLLRTTTCLGRIVIPCRRAR
ncbi:hypothetical protein K466DRAFT_281920 [Polyporus arcularius HHB13444]|uniref:Uncharacterized protein n=1 Tax=Polyporus arcularius HHB13444 TaxID=1314778 RepID=A0A5C3P1M8_9APHY|nr:hypothetical protein K466DRAFT_281920 [Polyporus arcularius HHB13444]